MVKFNSNHADSFNDFVSSYNDHAFLTASEKFLKTSKLTHDDGKVTREKLDKLASSSHLEPIVKRRVKELTLLLDHPTCKGKQLFRKDEFLNTEYEGTPTIYHDVIPVMQRLHRELQSLSSTVLEIEREFSIDLLASEWCYY